MRGRYAVLFLAIPALSLGQLRSRLDIAPPRVHAVVDSVLRDQSSQRDEQVNVIVEFRDEPMFIQRMNSRSTGVALSKASYESRFSQFALDAEAIQKRLPNPSSGPVKITREFYKTFFGVSTVVPAWMMPLIQNLPYVKSVHIDREVHASNEPDGTSATARVALTQTAGQGEGIRVGIIDSGVDYMHPALGGGFGPGHKVAGGYDLVNNDADPMDDNGHGTHVAGIVAADGDSVKGVAPHVTLYAYKALNAQGSGLESTILAAIERTVDPNQDGDDADRLDVVNLSLGSNGGSPTDPSSIAVDNATRLGVVMCVAAGNSGGFTPVEGKEDNYFLDGSSTIGTPGSSELAITVGAADSTDHYATFTSKGPNRVSYSIKPEVLAPGVNIFSTYLSSGYRLLTGTSMATPMVTGIAALVKGAHPTWSPALIKSAIVNTARDLGRSAYLQGGGRVQALRAVSARALAVPATLSYGMDDPSAGAWVRAETLSVSNRDSLPQSFAAAVSGLVPGVTLDIAPASFTLPARDSIRVIATIQVNNAVVAIEDANILRFWGTVSFNGTADTAKVPWAFARANRLVVTTSEPNAFFLGYSTTSTILSTGRTVFWTSPTRAEMFAPDKGTYEFFTVYRNPAGKSKIVIDEALPVLTNAAELFLDGTKAVVPLVFHGVDHTGNPLKNYPLPRRTLITGLPNFGDWATTFAGGSDTLLLSAVPSTHSFRPMEFQFDLGRSGTMHVVQFDRFAGMQGARTVTNSPAAFIQERFRVKVPPGTTRATQISILYSYRNDAGTGGFGGLGIGVDTVTVTRDEYSYRGYFGKSPSATEDVGLQFITSYSDFENLSFDYLSSFIMPYKDSIVAMQRDFVTPAIPRFADGSTMTFGGSPIHLLMVWLNNTFGTNSLHFRPIFRGMLNEERAVDVGAGKYSLFDKNGTHLFTKSLSEPRQPLELTAERYKMVVTSSNHWLRNARGTISLTSEFNLGNGTSANPPSITSLTLLDGSGRATDSLAKGDQASLVFAVNGNNFATNVLPIFDSTRAWYRKHGTTPWIPLAVTKLAEVPDNEGLIVRANLGSATLEDSIALDLRLASADVNGFTTDYVISPAFAVGNWDTVTVTEVPPSGDPGIPRQYVLEQNFPNPFNPSTNIRYGLPSGARVTLTLFNVMGQRVATLVNEDQEAGYHEIRFHAVGLATGVYFYRMEAGSFTQTKKLLLVR